MVSFDRIGVRPGSRFFRACVRALFRPALIWGVLFAVACSDSTGTRLEAQEFGPPISLFDGHTLQNWAGDQRVWTVEDGAITGRTSAEHPLDANSFLIWQGGEMGDFELRLKFRIEGGNSGVQYRSQDLKDFHVGGYQADIDASHEFIGILYEERGRGILAQRGSAVEIDEQGQTKIVGTTSDVAALLASLAKQDWNEYRIAASGNHLTQSINGYITVDVVDRQTDHAKSRGVLALQLHAGPPMKVQFKDIYLRRPEIAPESASISHGASDDGCQLAECRCRRSPTCSGGPRRSLLTPRFLRRCCR